MKKITKGTGTTKHKFIQISTESTREEFEAFSRQSMGCDLSDPLWSIRHMQKAAEHTLKQFGLSCEITGHILSDGSEAILSMLVQDQGYKEYDSIAWYAAEIYQAFSFLEKAIDENDVPSIVDNSAKIGELNKEAMMKSLWEPSVEKAMKAVSGGYDGGKQAERNRAPIRHRVQKTVSNIITNRCLWNDASQTCKSITDALWSEIKAKIDSCEEWQGISSEDLLQGKVGRQTVYDAAKETDPR